MLVQKKWAHLQHKRKQNIKNKMGSLISLCPGEIGVLKFVIKILEFNGEEATF